MHLLESLLIVYQFFSDALKLYWSKIRIHRKLPKSCNLWFFKFSLLSSVCSQSMQSVIILLQIFASFMTFIGISNIKLFLLKLNFNFIVFGRIFVSSHFQQCMVLINLSLMVLEFILKSNHLFSVQTCLFSFF